MEKKASRSYEVITVYHVHKIFPPRCPRCSHSFTKIGKDFAEWACTGDRHCRNFIEAKIAQAELMKEIYKPKRTKGRNGAPDLVGAYDGYDIEFIYCRHCENATMAIEYAHRQVLTREEAERLVDKKGFTYWSEGKAAGNMARPMSRLGFLGAADLARIKATFIEARKSAKKEKDPFLRGNLFFRGIDPALSEIMNKTRENILTTEAREYLIKSSAQSGSESARNAAISYSRQKCSKMN